MIRAVLVDDEALGRQRLRNLLAKQDNFTVIGEACNGLEAITLIEDKRPDLVFLDIQMPGLNGFDVVDRIGKRHMPPTIFVTAHSDWAVRAFEVQALDYLVKPYDSAGFERVVRRFLESKADSKGFSGARLISRRQGTVTIVDVGDVQWFQAAGDYCEAMTARGPILLDDSLNALSGMLPRFFSRIHRQYIVRLDEIKSIVPTAHGDGFVILRDSTKLRYSRRYRAVLRHLKHR